MGKPVDPTALLTSPRGMTGSEFTCWSYARGLAAIGHEVHWYTNSTSSAAVASVQIRPWQEWAPEQADYFDAVVSFMTPNALCDIQSTKPFKVFNQQCSDFGGCQPGWEQYVDALCVLSHTHGQSMRGMTPLPADKWRVQYNGVDLDSFKPAIKIPGRCIWASSHDRGLHHALELWPEVRREFPHAELHIFYDVGGLQAFASMGPSDVPFMQELQRRSVYEIEMMRRLRGHGVVLRGSVSREQMQREMGQAEVLLYPAEPVRFTETFGCAVAEAMASGCVPVLCYADAFGELFQPRGVPGVAYPFEPNRDEYVRTLLGVLRDPREQAKSMRERAADFAWDPLVKRFEELLTTRGASGLDPLRSEAQSEDPEYVLYRPYHERAA
jgi:glycosyltransferase involved in cell wall biosynthesis